MEAYGTSPRSNHPGVAANFGPAARYRGGYGADRCAAQWRRARAAARQALRRCAGMGRPRREGTRQFSRTVRNLTKPAAR